MMVKIHSQLPPAFSRSSLSHLFWGEIVTLIMVWLRGSLFWLSVSFCVFYRTDQEIQTYTIAVINALFLKAPDERRQVSCISLVLRLYSGLAIFRASSALSFPSWGLLGPPSCPAVWLASLGSFTDPVGSRWRRVSPCLRKNARNVPEAEPLHQMKPNIEAWNIKRWKPCCC